MADRSFVTGGVFAALVVVAQTVLFGALIGRPWTIARRIPRASGVAVGIGLASIVAVVGLGAIAATQSPFLAYITDPSHGQVEFGHVPASSASGCHVGDRSDTFQAGELSISVPS